MSRCLKQPRDSLPTRSCPEWFRDVKFGIWSHWGPQSVPMFGDWYARNMYIQGSPQTQPTCATTAPLRPPQGHLRPVEGRELWTPTS